MACNCRKKGTPPTGSGVSRAQQQAQRGGASTPPTGTPPKTSANSGAVQQFVLTTSSGRTMSFGSRLEANAARVREGGGTIRLR